jgi:hypothetical protein
MAARTAKGSISRISPFRLKRVIQNCTSHSTHNSAIHCLNRKWDHEIRIKQKWRLQKRNWFASQILRAVKRIEALKINKYLHPDYFFMGSHRSMHESGFKRTPVLLFNQEACHVASLVDAQITRLRHTLCRCFCCVSHSTSVTSRWRHDAWSVVCWCMERDLNVGGGSPNEVACRGWFKTWTMGCYILWMIGLGLPVYMSTTSFGDFCCCFMRAMAGTNGKLFTRTYHGYRMEYCFYFYDTNKYMVPQSLGALSFRIYYILQNDMAISDVGTPSKLTNRMPLNRNQAVRLVSMVTTQKGKYNRTTIANADGYMHRCNLFTTRN